MNKQEITEYYKGQVMSLVTCGNMAWFNYYCQRALNNNMGEFSPDKNYKYYKDIPSLLEDKLSIINKHYHSALFTHGYYVNLPEYVLNIFYIKRDFGIIGLNTYLSGTLPY